MERPIFFTAIVLSIIFSFMTLSYASDEIEEISIIGDEMIKADDDQEIHLPEMDEIVVTATRSERDVKDVPQKVTVITANEIEESRPETVAEMLQDISGVYIRSYGTTGTLQSVSIGGSSASQVLVLIDGIRTNDVQSGSVDFGNLSVENIERVEILHGAASALYGADALGGVINIITRSPSKGTDRTSLSLKLGAFNSKVYTITHETGFDKVALFSSLKHSDDVNDFAYFDRNRKKQKRKNNYYNALHAFQRVDWDINSLSRMSITAGYYHADKGVPGSLAFPSPSAAQGESNATMNLLYKNDAFIVDALDIETNIYYKRHSLQFNDPGSGIDSDHMQEALGGEIKQQAIIGETMTLTYGYSLREDNVYSIIDKKSGAAIERKSQTNALFIQDEIALSEGRLRIIPAVRYDRHSDFGGEFSPKAGLVYNMRSTATLRANYGSSFRSPTFNDLYWPEDNFAIGNPDLKPEHGKELGGGIKIYLKENSTLDVSIFRNNISDIIVWQPGQVRGKWAPVNISKAELSGVEIEFSIKMSTRHEFEVNYSYLEALNKDEKASVRNKQLPFKPRDMFNLRYKYSGNIWNYYIRGHYRGLQYSEPTNLIVEPDYYLFDVGISLKPFYGFGVSLDIRNALDEEYESVSSYPAPGREFRINTKYSIDWN